MLNMIKDEVFNKCTRCGKEFTDLKVSVELGLFVERLRDTGVWEDVPNMNQESKEYLCPDCFNKLCDILAQMNLPDATGTMKNDYNVILPTEERETECECERKPAAPAAQPAPARHRSHAAPSSGSEEEEMVEFVISSKIIKNGVEVPAPDDGQVVRMTKKEWLARQANVEGGSNQPTPPASNKEKNDVAHHADPDGLVDVCDDVIYG